MRLLAGNTIFQELKSLRPTFYKNDMRACPAPTVGHAIPFYIVG